MRTNPGDAHDALIEAIPDHRAVLLEQVPDDAPDMGVRMPMSAAEGLATADIPLQVGTIRDNVEGRDAVPQGQRESVDFAGFRVRAVKG